MTVITVEGDGWVLSYDSRAGRLTGDSDAAQSALRAARTGEIVPILGLFPVTASWDNPVEALAALVALRPGRAILTQAPPEVLGWLDAKFVWLRQAEQAAREGEFLVGWD